MPKALAIETGYFGVIREPGAEFEVPEGTKSNTWFLVDGDPAVDVEATFKEKAPIPGTKTAKLNPAEGNVL